MKQLTLHLGLIGASLLIVFQNCSPVAFKEAQDLASQSVDAPEFPVTCTFDGRTLNLGDSVTAYLASSVEYGKSCESEVRICIGGALSGSYSYSSCSVGTPKACLFNGQTIAHGATVTAYQNSAVDFGGTCVSEARKCDNGVLSGSYSFESCAVGAPKSCLFNGQTIPHNGTVVAYQTSAVEFGKTCMSETRRCTNGSLSGAYTFGSCSVGAPKSCLFNGRTLAHGESVTAYETSSVDYGKTCGGQTRTCNDGQLSGSYTFASCSVGAPKSCLFNGATIAHGQSVKAYKALSAAVCESQDRLCTNGALSGTYAFNTCEVPCTVEEKTKYLNSMIHIYTNIKNEEIATNCIDTAVTTLAANMPTTVISTLRYKNTCGNRYCVDKKGMASGRVIDMANGTSTLECRNEKTPSTYTGTCVKEIEKTATPLTIIQETLTNVMAICEPSNPELARPYTTEAKTITYFYTCGYRYCVKKGYADGRMVELNGNFTIAHCYGDYAGSLPSVSAPLNAVASSCIDSSYPTLATTLPNTPARLERFQSTCGNRYCQGQGYAMGHVVEFSADTAYLKCQKK